MPRIYIRLDTVAHMIALQQIREMNHREKRYGHDKNLQNVIRTEQSSALFWAFCKILEIAEMSHPISEEEKKKLRDLTYSGEYAKERISSWTLTKE